MLTDVPHPTVMWRAACVLLHIRQMHPVRADRRRYRNKAAAGEDSSLRRRHGQRQNPSARMKSNPAACATRHCVIFAPARIWMPHGSQKLLLHRPCNISPCDDFRPGSSARLRRIVCSPTSIPAPPPPRFCFTQSQFLGSASRCRFAGGVTTRQMNRMADRLVCGKKGWVYGYEEIVARLRNQIADEARPTSCPGHLYLEGGNQTCC